MVLCASCGSEQQSGAKFCDQCGARVANACASCGVELRPGARFCSECGASQVEAADVVPERPPVIAERKVTSVLFGDLVGFTSLSETRDKEDVRDLLSEYFAQCRRIVARYGGTVEKFIGDAVMAVWGVPAAHEDDAERAVRAGLELVRAVESLGEELKVAGLVLRVGIVTGEVAVTIGADHEGMVAGDAVNTAARVQSAAEPGQVWVDETTRLLTSGAITYVDVGSHPLKGKADPVPLWAVRAVVAAVGGAQRADGLEAPLTGRARELRLVKELFHGVEETGRPALVLVNGDPGLGKSRLAWEFEKYIDGLQVTYAWHSSRCLAYGEGVAFWPIAEAVRGRLGIVESDPDADPVAALDTWLARCVPDDEETAWLRPRILALLGRGSSGGYDRDDLFSAWRTFFEETQEERAAVVLLIDDAQHADDGTVQFVEHLLSTSVAPLFVMLMARPELLERWPALATNRRATVLHLATLEPQELADLLDGLVSGLPDDVRAGLVERAQGVPLYAIETVRSMIDRDLVVPRGGVYVLSDPDSVDLASIGAPASLQALVAARLDGLPPEQRRVVTDASVLGLTFTRGAIAALSGSSPDLDDTLTALTRLEILGTVGSRLSAEYGQYRFIQAVVRQVAYSTQARRDRKARHLAVASYFRALADPSGDHAPVLAQHYLDAIDASSDTEPDLPELRRLAVSSLTDAAIRARELGAPAEALRYLETALAHVSDDLARSPIHLAAAWAALDAAEVASSMEHSGRALDLCTAAGDRLGAGEAAAVRAQCLTRNLFNSHEAMEVAVPHWDALQDVPGAEEVLLALARPIANSQLNLGVDPSDIILARLRIAESIGDRQTIADSIIGLGTAQSPVRPTLAGILLRSGTEIAREEQRPRMASIGLSNHGLILLPRSVDACLALFEEAAEAISKGGSDPYAVTLNGLNVAWASFLSGAWAVSEQLLDEVAPILHAPHLKPCVDAMLSDAIGRPRRYPTLPASELDTEDEGLEAYCLFATAMEARARGDLAAAATLSGDAFERIFHFGGLYDDSVYMWPLAVETALVAADDAALRRALAPVDGAPRGLRGIAWTAHRSRFAGLIAIAEDDTEGVEPNLRAAIAGFDEWGSPVYKAKAQADLAVWLERQGRLDDAAPLKQASLEVLQRLGANGWLGELGWSIVPAAAAP